MVEIFKSDEGRQAVHQQYRRALERWPVPSEQRLVPTREGDTFVIASGDPSAPPLVLLHGSGANSSAWMRDVGTWSRQHRVYAVDMIGEPGFSAPSRLPLASAAHADWLEDVWTGLGLEDANVVGVSLGGWLGLDFAVRRPHRVRSLTLVSPSGIGRQNVSMLLKVGLLRLFGTWGLLKSLELVSGRKTQLPQPLIDALLVVFRNFRPRMGRVPRVSDGDLAKLSMPVHLIVGAEDALLDSCETRSRVERFVRNASVTWVEGSGHILPPQTSTVAAFLERTMSKGASAAGSAAVA